MSALHLVYSGPPEQKQTLKVTAMQRLSDALPEVCAKFRPPLDPSSITLALNKKPVDITCPFRLANVPAGSILVITSSRPAAAATPTSAAQPAPVQQAAASASEPSASARVVSPQPTPAPPPPPPAVQPEAPSPAPAAAPVALSQQPPVEQLPAPQPDVDDCMAVDPPAPPPLAAAAAAAEPLSVDQPVASSTPRIDFTQVSQLLGLSPPREVLITTEAALMAHQSHQAARLSGGGARGDDDDDDSFYELTPEDLAEIARAAEARRKEEGKGLKTQALRQAEEAARIQSIGPVALRLRFTDGLVVQAVFHVTEKLEDVHRFVCSLLQLPSAKLVLFTTPPKQILTDLSLTLYKAGLFPAALVHCQVVNAAGPTLQLLRPEIHSCLHTTLEGDMHLPGQHDEPTPAQGEGSSGSRPAGGAAGQATRPAATELSGLPGVTVGGQAGGAGGAASGQAKLPKWLKLK